MEEEGIPPFPPPNQIFLISQNPYKLALGMGANIHIYHMTNSRSFFTFWVRQGPNLSKFYHTSLMGGGGLSPSSLENRVKRSKSVVFGSQKSKSKTSEPQLRAKRNVNKTCQLIDYSFVHLIKHLSEI